MGTYIGILVMGLILGVGLMAYAAYAGYLSGIMP